MGGLRFKWMRAYEKDKQQQHRLKFNNIGPLKTQKKGPARVAQDQLGFR